MLPDQMNATERMLSSRGSSESIKSAYSTSSSTSSEAKINSTSLESEPSSYVGQLPAPVASFFQNVSRETFPERVKKAQPWMKDYKPQKPSPDGKLIIACPKKCDYGSNNLGGY